MVLLLCELWERQKRGWSDFKGTMQDRQMVFTFQLQAWSSVCVCVYFVQAQFFCVCDICDVNRN